MAPLVLAASQPSWYWYATRGLGVTTLLVLTSAVVLGIGTSRRWGASAAVGFVTAELHRNLSLLAAGLLLAHIVTTVLDPFAHISVRDSLIPVGASYRPTWLGLGVLSAELTAAVVVTSLFRHRLGPRLWKLVHWGAYLSWPTALLHTLGTGSDARAPWLIGLAAACTLAVLLAVEERLEDGSLLTLPARWVAWVGTLAVALGCAAWAVAGPLQANWASRAGTPPVRVEAVHSGKSGFSDPLVGVLAHNPAGTTELSLRDTVDPTLTISVRSPGATETLPVMSVARSGRQLCSVPAEPATTLYAVCGSTRIVVALYGTASVEKSGGPITGRLDTSGPLL